MCYNFIVEVISGRRQIFLLILISHVKITLGHLLKIIKNLTRYPHSIYIPVFLPVS